MKGIKQTIEEAAEQFEYVDGIYGFEQGVEWQAKQMYSEEEVLDFLEFVNDRLPDLYSRFSPQDELDEWSKQNKKN
jgi:cell division septum initiation protein DivIVA